ncbi:MAG: diaminopimelate decarboxylase [Acetobacteraceae bacterium]|nr:diaminopimelate decarboxylase [Acetobacteraceae bacterium]
MSAALPVSNDDPATAELIAARPHLSLHAMDGLLVEGVPLQAIARSVGTPTWVISAGALRSRLQRLQSALTGLPISVHYAVKANDHLAVLRLMANGGAGADVVSGGELQRALQAGIDPAQIVFSGVGKQEWELRFALEREVGQINVESAEELAMLSATAAAIGRTAKVALRINPDVDAGTHAKITTGRADNKFGISYAEAPSLYAHAAGLPGIDPVGIALHIGSQILSMTPYHAAYRRAAELVRVLRTAEHPVRVVDCGGGLGIGYRDEPPPPPEAFAATMRQAFGGLDVRLAIEPGRWLAGPAGLLLSSVVLSKMTGSRRFVVLDAAMNDLLRPAMYEAWHGIVPVSATDAVASTAACDVVGPVCETGDTFARARRLPLLAPGAMVAILDAGAYGSVMSSTYNARPLAAQVLVDGDRWTTIRERQAADAMWAGERIPEWLG